MPHFPRSRVWLLLAATITLQLVLSRSARALKHEFQHHKGVHLSKRSDGDYFHTTLLELHYSDWYSSANPTTKPFILMSLILCLTFLFSFIGITASDFFCPNLSSIARYLGLSESTAGVTFLAFGNGSPDVFSTFAALKGGTLGLAVGELIGAASFIVSIVVGSIALIKPFHVPKHAFLRDVLFFTSAVIVLIFVLHDGHLTLWESGGMVALYLTYVAVIVAGNYWQRKQRDKEDRRALYRGSDGDGNGHVGLVGSSTQDGVAVRPILPNLSLPSSSAQGQSSPRRQTSSPSLRGNRSPKNQSPTASPSRRTHRPRSHTTTSHYIPRDLSPSDYPVDTPRANFSLLGAVEFRDVVNSLKRESESRAASPGRTPHAREETEDYFGPIQAYSHRRSSSIGVPTLRHANHLRIQRHHRHRSEYNENESAHPSRSNSRPRLQELNPNPWEDQVGNPPTPFAAFPTPRPERERLRLAIPQSEGRRVPSISIVDPSGVVASPSALNDVHQKDSIPRPASNESRLQLRRRMKMALRILFPSLQSFRHKSIVGMILAIMSVPAILALTVTLPVVDDGHQDEGGIALPGDEDDNDNSSEPDADAESESDADSDRPVPSGVGSELHHLVDHGFSPLHSPLGRMRHSTLRRVNEGVEAGYESEGEEEDSKELLEEMEEEEAIDFHKGLTAVQCICGPVFCALIIFQEASYLKWILLGIVTTGSIAAILVLMNATNGDSKTWRLVRCFAGFVCAMVWIAAIADEVVSILQAVGEILGLSDAIIGLTIFAVGNSLADLVANVTVAQFAPAMAYAACFGGPMLNLLLGIGGSGTYHMLTSATHKPVKIHFSPTLWVSAGGLLLMLIATAIVVPMNGYLIDRRWAGILIVGYVVVMGTNIAVEIKTGRA